MKYNEMKHKKYYVGLDIGTTKIVAMVGVRNEYDKIQILGYGQSKSKGIDKGVVNNIVKTTQSILEAIRDAEEKTGLQIKNVVVGIAGQHILSRSHSDYIIRPDAEKLIDLEDLEQLKQQVYRVGLAPGQKIIHALPQEYKVDDQGNIREPIGMTGARLDASFHLVIGQLTSIKNITRCVESAELKFTGLTLEPIASASAVLSEEEKEVGVVLVDIGGGTTDVAIFKDGIIRHTAVIDKGGNIITEDIKEGCAILEQQAEELKVRFGSAWPGENRDNEIVSIPGLKGREPKEITLRNLSEIIHARVCDIIDSVFNVIKSYGHEEHRRKLIAGIVLTGGGSQLKHIVQLVKFRTGMDVRIGYPNEHLASNSDEKLTSPIYATSIGLVMSAIDYETEEIIRARLEKVMQEEKQQKEQESSSVPTPEVEKQPVEDDVEDENVQKRKLNPFDRIGNWFKDLLDKSEY